MIDPVRFISNFSTGEMGYRLAERARQQGHKVTLLTGPTFLRPPKGVKVISFQSGEDLSGKLIREFKKTDVLFMSAAISDYAPAKKALRKIKRDLHLTLKLTATPDLLKRLIPHKRRQITVGFCLETEDLARHAQRKLEGKKLDYIVGNFLSPKSNPFGDRKTTVLLLDKTGRSVWFRKKTKREVADLLLKEICSS